MKLHLALIAGIVSAWCYEPCFGSYSLQVDAPGDAGATFTIPAGRPDLMYHMPHGGHPTMPVGTSVPAGVPVPWGYPQHGVPVAWGHPGSLPTGEFHPNHQMRNPGAATRETSALEGSAENPASPVSEERAARRALVRAIVFVVLMNVLLHVVRAVEGNSRDGADIMHKFIFSIPDFMHLGGIFNFLWKFKTWVSRYLARRAYKETPMRKVKTQGVGVDNSELGR